MENSKFDQPVTVKGGTASTVMALRGPREAVTFLMNNWLGKRTDKHRAALQACSDVIDRGSLRWWRGARSSQRCVKPASS